MTAYAESHYLDMNADKEIQETQHQLGNLPIEPSIKLSSLARVSKNDVPVSEYCGFVSDELPPIYREQFRKIQKDLASRAETSLSATKIEKQYAEQQLSQNLLNPNEFNFMDDEVYFSKPQKNHGNQNQGGSGYAYHTNDVHTNIYTRDYNTMDIVTKIDYVPGFSPPHNDDEIHRRIDHKLPKNHGAVVATEHIYHRNGSNWVKEQGGKKTSAYFTMPNEDFNAVNAKKQQKKLASNIMSRTGSLDASAISATESTVTASLGPKMGELHKTPRNVADKYKGLSAFKPVSNSIESQYAYPELN